MVNYFEIFKESKKFTYPQLGDNTAGPSASSPPSNIDDVKGFREKWLSLRLPPSTRLEISLSSKTLTLALALTMPWCPHCSDEGPTADAAAQLKSSPAGESTKRRFTSCSACGRVLKDRPFTSLDKTLSFIHDIAAAALAGDESSVIVGDAQDLLRRAVDSDSELFAGGGRRHVAAACVYAALRRHRKPYMLVDLSSSSKVGNFYALGAVFVALSKIITRDSEPCCPFVDPSLLMHRMSTRLLGEKDAEVAAAALRILSGTRKPRDWMLSSDREVAIKLCSAALHVAAAARGQGREFSQSEVFGAVRVEFERGGWEKLTTEEFISRAAETSSCSYFGSNELVCRHKGSYDRAHCCYGLCRECCDVFEELQRDKTEEEEEDSDDISVYLNTEREKNYKTIVWELMNKNYIEEQASEIPADDTKIMKERKRRREGDIGRGAKATKEKQKEQRLSSRINYNALSQFYETDNNGITNEHGNEEENKEEFYGEAIEDYNEEEEEEEAYGGDKSAEDQGYDDFCDLGEDYGEGNCDEFDGF